MSSQTDMLLNVPDVARLWVIPTDRTLTREEQTAVSSHLAAFFGRWQSHGRKVEAESVILHNRFIVVSAYVPGDDVSGCGIDASVHELDQIASTVGFGRAPVLDIFFNDGSEVRNVSRAEFAELARSGRVTADTTIFDASLSSASDWNAGRFARPVSESWHAAVFF